MATKETPIEFTVGDQERLVTIENSIRGLPGTLEALNQTIAQVARDINTSIETVGTRLHGRIDGLPCKLEPPVCSQETRIKSLESSREKWYRNIAYIIAASLVGLLGWLATLVHIHPPDGM